ncbi:hypothetical protein ElyMa_005797900 [Elysia marginata]|uniref:Uncharacterized protein n=1 Tax=Elysia marginata TaxID=1093978 RepID=A0AAV4FSB6_9GAST|nr:hypothetical protein ElyMa_005797900 [Elysia marginata]
MKKTKRQASLTKSLRSYTWPHNLTPIPHHFNKNDGDVAARRAVGVSHVEHRGGPINLSQSKSFPPVSAPCVQTTTTHYYSSARLATNEDRQRV